MKIKFIILAIFLLAATSVFATGVPIETAKQIAKNLYFEKSGVVQSKIYFTDEIIIEENNTALYYIFNIADNKGFVIVSADDVINPIIGYSLNNSFITENQPDNIANWMQQYIDGINYKRENNIVASNSTKEKWTKYAVKNSEFETETKAKDVSPLTDHIKWNQGTGWNQYTPDDTYTGCVATAMGIIMKYYEYPARGNGNYAYTPEGYNEQSVNFSDAEYNYSAMSNSSATDEAAELLYHAGVSVQMQYGTEGSAAYTQDVRDAMWYFFLYEFSGHATKSESSDWQDILKTELDNGRPIFYAGESDEGGHAFICDGYSDTDLFHFNFGWGGYDNGFFNINSDNFTFNSEQECLTGIKPDYNYKSRDIKKLKEYAPGLYERLCADNIKAIIFPNPSHDIFNIVTLNNILSVEVYNITGQKIHEVSNQNYFDISTFASGIYFAKIKTEKEVIIKEIIKE